MSRRLFNQRILASPKDGAPGILIRIGHPGSGLGHFNPQVGEIVIDADQPYAGKHIVLVHELLHVVDEMLVSCGHRKRRVSHDWISKAAPNLLACLIETGQWRGLSIEDLTEFLDAPAAGGGGKA